nr:TetR family transcriptional regulator [Amycolatopsis granulosa]
MFAALERVIARDGAGRLSGRAVTGEAGVATGLLYAHFADVDDFLAAYAVDRAFLVSAGAASLPGRVGTGDVAGNLCAAALSASPATVLTLTRLLVSRPELAGRVQAVLGDRTAGFDAIETAAAAYLAGEQRVGRVAADADPAALALALVGVLHRLVLAGDAEPERITRAITGLISAFAPATAG